MESEGRRPSDKKRAPRASQTNGASRRRGERVRLSGSPRGDAPRISLAVRELNYKLSHKQRASAASEPDERSEPAPRRAREAVGESEGRRPSDKTRIARHAT